MLPTPLNSIVRFQSASLGNVNGNGVPAEELGAARKLVQSMLYSWTVLPEEAPQNPHPMYRPYDPYADYRPRRVWTA